MNTPLAIPVPELHEFTVPEDASVSSVTIDMPMTDACNKYLIQGNFNKNLRVGPFRGGFIRMDHEYFSDEGVKAVGLLAGQTRRKFRQGSTLEFIFFKNQNHPIPECCLMLKSMWNINILDLDPYATDLDFDIPMRPILWSPDYEFFFVEDDPEP
jgi:hypothetical protein